MASQHAAFEHLSFDAIIRIEGRIPDVEELRNGGMIVEQGERESLVCKGKTVATMEPEPDRTKFGFKVSYYNPTNG